MRGVGFSGKLGDRLGGGDVDVDVIDGDAVDTGGGGLDGDVEAAVEEGTPR